MTNDPTFGPYKGLEYILTCIACPEQWDVRHNDETVGYIRLRWATLTADYIPEGKTLKDSIEIYREITNPDDSFDGSFESDEQRQEHLTNIGDELLKYLQKDSRL
jgi:hypothetical protein